MTKKKINSKYLTTETGTITLSADTNKECLRIERNGKIVWTVDGKEKQCNDFQDLAKAFMYCLFRLSPKIDWRGVAPEIYGEIKHLIKEKK